MHWFFVIMFCSSKFFTWLCVPSTCCWDCLCSHLLQAHFQLLTEAFFVTADLNPPQMMATFVLFWPPVCWLSFVIQVDIFLVLGMIHDFLLCPGRFACYAMSVWILFHSSVCRKPLLLLVRDGGCNILIESAALSLCWPHQCGGRPRHCWVGWGGG